MLDRFFDRLARGWNLSLTAFRVLRTDKKLLIFPLLSSIALIFVSVSFFVPLFLSDAARQALDNNLQNATTAQKVGLGMLVFAFYFCNYFVIVFFNSALIACAL